MTQHPAGDGDTRPTDRERLTKAEERLRRWLRKHPSGRAAESDLNALLAARAPAPPDAAQAQAKADALRSQRDFFLSIDMFAAADLCEEAAVEWESARDDCLRADRLVADPGTRGEGDDRG